MIKFDFSLSRLLTNKINEFYCFVGKYEKWGVEMAITLRVVGIFYRTTVELKNGDGTVKEVLDAARDKVGFNTFNYMKKGSGATESPFLFRAFYEADFKSEASGITYSKGAYSLAESENFNTNPYSVWQYYIFDKDGKFLNKDKGFVPYNDPVKAVVKDGQSVTWRLVNVLSEPREVNPRNAGMLGIA